MPQTPVCIESIFQHWYRFFLLFCWPECDSALQFSIERCKFDPQKKAYPGHSLKACMKHILIQVIFIQNFMVLVVLIH